MLAWWSKDHEIEYCHVYIFKLRFMVFRKFDGHFLDYAAVLLCRSDNRQNSPHKESSSCIRASVLSHNCV